MRILTLARYQVIDFRRNLMLLFMPIMMLAMAGFFALLNRQGILGPDGLPHAVAIAVTVATLVPTGMLTAMSIGEEKERRTLEALLLTPVKPGELIASRLLTASTLSIISCAIALSFFWVPLANPGLILLYLLLAGGWTIATGLLVGVISEDLKVATGYIQMIVTVPISMMGVPWAQAAPKVWAVLRFLPYRPALELIRGGVVGGVAWAEPALVLTAWLAATILLTITQIRKRGFVR